MWDEVDTLKNKDAEYNSQIREYKDTAKNAER